MPRRKKSDTPLTDLFISRAAEGMADATWCDQHGNVIRVTPGDIERYAPAGTSPEAIEETKRLAQEGIDERARRKNS